jgi:hypothetical protein
MALTVRSATFPCPCPQPTPSTKLVLHYCSFTVLTDGTTLHCVLLSLQCFRHFEKVKDAFTHFPARLPDTTVAEQDFVSLAYPAAQFSLPNPNASPLPQDFASLAYPAAQFSLPNPSASSLPQDFASLAYPAAHFSRPNPSASSLPGDFVSLAYPAAHFSLPNPSASPLPPQRFAVRTTHLESAAARRRSGTLPASPFILASSRRHAQSVDG